MRRCCLLLVCLLLLTGCGRADTQDVSSFAPAEGDRLVIFTSHKETIYEPILKEFEQRTGIWVELETGGTVTLLERIAAGEDVIYCSSANIFREIEREYMADFRNDTVLRELKACDLLILDDLGSEYLNAVVLNAIYDLVNTRISEGKSTVFTTNLVEQKQLEARYGESITSRLLGCCEKLAFDGEEDIRRLPIRPPRP